MRYLSKKHEVTVLSINDWWKGKQANHEAYWADFYEGMHEINYKYLTERRVNPLLQEVFFHKKSRTILKDGFDTHLSYASFLTGNEIAGSIGTVLDLADDEIAMIRQSPQLPKLLKSLGSRVGQFYLKSEIAKAHKITVSTERLKQIYRVPEHKAHLLPNGVDLELFRHYKDAKKDLGLDGFVVGYVGVLREWVDLSTVFEALQSLNREITMLVVGKEGRFEETLRLAKKIGVADRVRFTGGVHYAEVPHYMSAMDVCVIPFAPSDVTQSALPLKLFEYMACERPVIAAELAGIKAAVGNTISYASDSAGYVESIRVLYEDRELRKSVGSKGRRLVETSYDWAQIAKDLDSLLVEVSNE
jgi:glycosyltransferase involved in cell wall biosynthesis